MEFFKAKITQHFQNHKLIPLSTQEVNGNVPHLVILIHRKTDDTKNKSGSLNDSIGSTARSLRMYPPREGLWRECSVCLRPGPLFGHWTWRDNVVYVPLVEVNKPDDFEMKKKLDWGYRRMPFRYFRKIGSMGRYLLNCCREKLNNYKINGF